MSRPDAANPVESAYDHRSAAPPTSGPVKVLILLAIGVLVGFIGFEGNTLFVEWSELRRDVRENRMNRFIGYENISPNPCYAAYPADWYRDDGEHTLLWSGWKSGTHQWFRIGRGDLDRERLSIPFGRDSIQAIDVPMVEIGDGARWRRIPDDAAVAGIEISGKGFVYPIKLLEKVEVINELLEGIPLVVTYAPFAIEKESVAIYEAAIDGRRLSLGVSGYFFGRQPLFYDRESESLWAGTEEGLSAVAGPHKGKSLRTIGRPVPVAWSDWRSRYPRSRLVVGAARPLRAEAALARVGSKSPARAAP